MGRNGIISESILNIVESVILFARQKSERGMFIKEFCTLMKILRFQKKSEKKITFNHFQTMTR